MPGPRYGDPGILVLRVGANPFPDSVQSLFALLPVTRNKLVGLQSIKNSEDFIDIATDSQVVDGQISEHALRVDQENTAICDAGGFVEDTVRGRQLMVRVGKHQMLQAFQAGMAVAPALVRVNTIGTGRQQDTLALGERLDGIVESNDFRRADKCEVERIKVQADPLAAIVRQFHCVKLTFSVIFRSIVSVCFKRRSGLSNTSSH